MKLQANAPIDLATCLSSIFRIHMLFGNRLENFHIGRSSRVHQLNTFVCLPCRWKIYQAFQAFFTFPKALAEMTHVLQTPFRKFLGYS